ncbi:MAG: DUF1467 family protein [Rhodobiaceae bacterium]|nr:DUF1467 family protein [Rhodobiaceae bacterium]MCC0016374.1 DUF1467 family protein [Rhodobiaceae bacterium]MCC0041316.1 DUF1467 family protein [Rhodobiaceae bacterium]MCC0052710.1 DUF1467 family protein [Rhodobiaceae bacterium]
MSFTSALAIYFIVWWLTLFAVLPFGVRTQAEAGEVVPGSPESAPARFAFFRTVAITTVISAIIFAGVYFLLTSGWIGLDDIPLFRRPNTL